MIDPVGLWDIIPRVEKFLEEHPGQNLKISVSRRTGKREPTMGTVVVLITTLEKNSRFEYIGGPASVEQVDMLHVMVNDLYKEIA